MNSPSRDVRTEPLTNRFPQLEDFEIMAFKSMGTGTANEGQQKIVLEVLMNKICCYTSMTFAENQKDQDFGEGRRFVGHVIQEVLTTPTMENSDAGQPAKSRRKPAHPAPVLTEPARGPEPSG